MSAKAERVLEIGATFVERGKRMDELATALARESLDYKRALDELGALGCTHPSVAQYFSHSTRALATALMSSPLQVEHLAPRERQTFAQFSGHYEVMADRWASQYLAQAAE